MRIRPFALLLTILAIFIVLVTACSRLHFAQKGERYKSPRQASVEDVMLEKGFHTEVVVTGLNTPTSLAFDEEDRAYVTEGGYGKDAEARLLRVEPDGSLLERFKGPPGPWVGAAFAKGDLYLVTGSKLFRHSKDDKLDTLAEGLVSPTRPIIGPDGALYFGQVIQGRGAIMRVSPTGTLDILAQGFRTLTGLSFAPKGDLFATDESDRLFRVQPGPQINLPTVCPGFDFSRETSFGFPGQAFLAQSARVVRADPEKGTFEDFVWNKDGKGPASRIGSFGIEHPIDVRFDRKGKTLFILDDGVIGVERTGVLWKITKK